MSQIPSRFPTPSWKVLCTLGNRRGKRIKSWEKEKERKRRLAQERSCKELSSGGGVPQSAFLLLEASFPSRGGFPDSCVEFCRLGVCDSHFCYSTNISTSPPSWFKKGLYFLASFEARLAMWLFLASEMWTEVDFRQKNVRSSTILASHVLFPQLRWVCEW